MGFKPTLLFIALFTTLLQASPCRGESYDFRNSRWGMNKIEVMALEKLKPISFSGPYLTYQDTILGREMHIIYEFIKNRLVGAYYIFVTRSNREYLDMRKLLEQKYGPPKESRNTNASDYLFFWETETTEIELKPGRAKDCRIEYNSISLKHLRVRQQEAKRKERERNVLEAF